MGNFTDFFTYGMGGFINSFNHSLSLSLAFWRERARARRSAAPNVDFHGNLTETHSETHFLLLLLFLLLHLLLPTRPRRIKEIFFKLRRKRRWWWWRRRRRKRRRRRRRRRFMP
jgi:hypothetical protein